MNIYKTKAYNGIKSDISILQNRIEEKEEIIARKKTEIEQLENEIMECEKSLNQALDFKMELEKGESTR